MSGIDPIAGLQALSPIEAAGAAAKPGSTKETGDASLFSRLLDEVSQLQSDSAALEQKLYSDIPVDLHQVMIAAEKAGTAVELLVEMRNRLVESYQELMRMPV